MDEKRIIMYVVVSCKRKPELYTLRQSKGECIFTFEANMETEWKEAKKYGWKCIKVDVTIQAMSNVW